MPDVALPEVALPEGGPTANRRPFAGGAGLLLAGGPLALVLVETNPGSSPIPFWAGAASLLIVGAGVWLPYGPRLGRWLASLALGAAFVEAWPRAAAGPLVALASVVIVILVLTWLWTNDPVLVNRRTLPRQPVAQARTRAASLVALTALGWLKLSAPAGPLAWPAVAASLIVAAMSAMDWLVYRGRQFPRRAAGLVAAFVVAATTAWLGGGDAGWLQGALALVPAVALVLLPVVPRPTLGRIDWWEPIMGHPARLLTVTFLALSAVGSVVLALPLAATSGRSLGFIDSAFTAVSAVCVTGLVVRDTAVEVSLFGQVVILVLIQLGGVGIMTFSTAAIRLLGRRMSLRHEGAVAGLISVQDRSRLFASAREILVFTGLTELIGSLCLFGLFLGHGERVASAAFRAVFTAVSAFCNAGFALQSDSLVAYQTSPAVLHVTGLLIVLGGLSPVAVLGLARLARRRSTVVAAQVRLAGAVSLALAVVGLIAIAAFEWTHGLAALSPWDRLHNAWFQSLTLRTAGFNSIDLTALRLPTVTVMIVLMFIGGSPGGTAGGIKTTTLAILILAVVAAVRGRPSIDVFGRSLSVRTVYRAAAIVTVGIAAVLLGLLAVLLTQRMPGEVALFEVVSALATVGLSIGGTALLDDVGKVLVMAGMFAGRVGPLTLFLFLSGRPEQIGWKRPEEDVEVG